jgi:pimeloyl-ACP methyl ester carboxylesterase
MPIVERGSGPPLVIVPGVQGRWEWVEPTVNALAESFRVITFSLCDEPESPNDFRRAATLDELAGQIGAALDDRGIASAAICGISFGGLVSLRFAAQEPARTGALILVSVPGPGWHLRRTHEVYVRYPRLFAPLFFATSPARLNAEIRAAIRRPRDRWRFRLKQIRLLARAPLSPTRMAARAQLIASAAAGIARDCRAVQSPTLIVCGESHLDHVVTVDGTLEYARLIRDARVARLEQTGHLGSVTRPQAFASLVREFLTKGGNRKAGCNTDAA